MASWGLLMVVVLLAVAAVKQLPRKWAIGPAFALVSVVSFFSILTISANRRWENDHSLFTYSVSQNNEYAEGLSALALIELDNNHHERSLAFARRAIASGNNPEYRSYWSRFGTYTNAGLAALNLNQPDVAIEFLELAKATRPGNSLSYYHLGLANTALGKTAEAIRSYQQALAIDPRHHRSRNNLGHIFLVQQRLNESIEVLLPAIEAQPDDPIARANIATAYLLRQQFAESEKHFEALVLQTPEDAINLAKLAWAEFEQNKRTEAQMHLDRARQLNPHHGTVRFVERKYSQAGK